LAEVVVVHEGLDGLVIVDVLNVEKSRQPPAAKLPPLVDADVELVKQRQAPAERLAAQAHVRRAVGGVQPRQRRRRDDGSRERPRYDAEAAADLPAPADAIASEHDQIVGLIEIERALFFLGPVLPHAARERVSEPAEEALVRLVLQERLQPERLAGAVVVVFEAAGGAFVSRHEPREVLVEPLDAELHLA
jgi:hypothetical protein